MAPSVKTIHDRLSYYREWDRAKSNALRKALKQADDTGGKARDKAVDRALELANELLDGHGTEAIHSGDYTDPYYGDIVAVYVNMGDTYIPTVIYDVVDDRFRIEDFGTFVEAYERKHGALP